MRYYGRSAACFEGVARLRRCCFEIVAATHVRDQRSLDFSSPSQSWVWLVGAKDAPRYLFSANRCNKEFEVCFSCVSSAWELPYKGPSRRGDLLGQSNFLFGRYKGVLGNEVASSE